MDGIREGRPAEKTRADVSFRNWLLDRAPSVTSPLLSLQVLQNFLSSDVLVNVYTTTSMTPECRAVLAR